MEDVILIKGIRYVPEILLKLKEAEIRELNSELRRCQARDFVSVTDDNHG